AGAIERTGTRLDHSVLDGDGSTATVEPDRSAGNPAVAYQKVRAGADHGDRDFRRQRRQYGGEIHDVGRLEQYFGRTADPKPSLPADRRVRGQPTANRGKPTLRDRLWRLVSRVHAIRFGDCNR